MPTCTPCIYATLNIAAITTRLCVHAALSTGGGERGRRSIIFYACNARNIREYGAFNKLLFSYTRRWSLFVFDVVSYLSPLLFEGAQEARGVPHTTLLHDFPVYTA